MKNVYLDREIIYGPVTSRRLGLSLGINLWPNSRKVCSFDCLYCECGAHRAVKSDDPLFADKVVTPKQVADALLKYLQTSVKPEYITFSGSGESTLHPQFANIVRKVREVRDQWAPSTDLALLSNSTGIASAKVRDAVALFDVPIMKLDAGDEETFQMVNQPAEDVRFADIISGLVALPTLFIQTLMFEGERANSSDAQVTVWIEQIGKIKPKSVQLYTLDRPAPIKKLRKCSPERLQDIAMATQKKTGVPVCVYGG